MVLKSLLHRKLIFSSDFSTYKVHEIYKEKPSYCVTFHIISNEANCSCHMFEFSGILCRHVLNVLLKKIILSLPSEYMLRRWNVDAKKGKVTGLTADQFEEGSNKSSSALLFNSIMVHSLGVSERGSRSDNHHAVTVKGFQKIIEDLDLLDLEDTNEELGIQHLKLFQSSVTVK